MIKFRNKIKLLLVFLLVISSIWANFNFYYFAHIHVDENGNIIVHAHPYQKGDQKSPDTPNHTHSKNEFIFLASFYQTLSLFALFLFFVIFYLDFNPNLKTKFFTQWNPAEIFFENVLRRGPPSFVQF